MVRALAFLLCGTLRCDSDLVPHQTCGLSLLLVLALLSGFPGLKKGPCDGFVTKQVSFHSHLPNVQIPIPPR